MKIEVTQEHIDKGIRCDNNYCPIALALKEHTTLAVSVTPYLFRILAVGGESIYIYTVYLGLFNRVSKFIDRFDGNELPKPFSFNLSAECFMI